MSLDNCFRRFNSNEGGAGNFGLRNWVRPGARRAVRASPCWLKLLKESPKG